MVQSDAPPPYVERGLQGRLGEALADTPVVCLLGPRQCGKSTLAARQAPERAYISLDDANYLNVARDDPQGFVAELPEFVTIDEIQRVPELTLAIKRSVDANRRPGRFLLTGSANLLQLPRLADSLAGRMECLHLNVFTESEKEGAEGHFLRSWLGGGLGKTLSGNLLPPEPSGLPARLISGGYPEASRRSPDRARQWQMQYIQSIIERDIHDVARIKDGGDIARLLELLSQRTASLLNVSNHANALGHTRATVERYLAILEKLFLIRRLPAWHRNTGKRLVKAPKIHVRDSGLAAALSDLREDAWLTERKRFGHLLESFVLQQLVAQASWTDPGIRFWHYRDKDRVEVDCVLTRGSKVWGVEIKSTRSVGSGDTRGLQRLANLAGKNFQGGVVFYDGSGVLPLTGGRFVAVPISKLWEM